MAIVRKAVAQDFEKAYPLFAKFSNPRLSKDDWRQLFIDHWHSNEGYFGYVLEDGERIVGFLGLIFGHRTLNARKEKFCNISSWVVDEKFRNQSLFLLLPVLKLKGYTLTIFTGSKEVYAAAKKLGFQDLESHLQIIPPLPSIATWLTSCQIEVDGKYLSEALTGEALQTYRDHLAFRCFHVHVRSPLGECYLVGTRVFRKNLTFAQIYHISDPNVFVKFSSRIAMAICLRIKTVAIATDQRFLGENTIPLSLAWPLPNRRVYKSSSLGKNDIDLLYSEYPALNI
jgi:hypothetical protein